MGMYSGIGSFAKKFQTGGGVQQEDGGSSGGSGLGPMGGDSGSTTTGTPLTFEQFVAAYGGNPGGLIGGLAADVAYQAYLQAYGVSGGNVDVTRGNITTGSNTLPSYLSINPETGLAVIPVGTTNRQFVEAMKILGLISEEDYSWLTQYFTGESGERTWLADIYNQPDTNVNRDNFFGNNDLNAENTSIMNRLFDVFDAGSQAGGFTPAEGFYQAGFSVGFDDVRGTPEGGTATGATAPAPVFYTLDDILVSSSEQPNLYDRFDPYPADDFQGYRTQNNPYRSAPTIGYGYQAPPTITTNPNNLVFETEEAEAVDPVVDEAEVVDTTQGTGGTGITVDESAVTGTTDNTAGTATTPTTPTTSTTGPLSGYQNIAAFREEDPYLFGKRGMLSGMQALAGSRRDLTAEEFQSLISGQQGRYGEGSTLMYDPRFGIYSTISDAELQRLRETQSVPDYIDPRLMTKEERIRSNMMSGGTYSRAIEVPFGYNPDLSGGAEAAFSNTLNTVAPQDPEVSSFYLGRGRLGTRIGDTQYFVNEDGSVTAYDVKDIEYDYTPSFAEGGIVDVYDDDMVSMQTTGAGIESFLNPERSKATLRRNLAKLAPRPTAPVMQQGIMPMAR